MRDEVQAVRRVCAYIDAHLDSEMEVAELARQVNLSPHHFSMLFKRTIGVSPHQYVLHKRIHAAKRHLAAGGLTLSEVALSLGFCDQSHFSRAFRKITGTTPRQYGELTDKSKPPGALPGQCL
jgi:AraC family transcriptional regulator